MADRSATCPDKPSVFIIDDSDEVRLGLERLVRSAGLNAETFDSAEAFLERGPCAGPGCVVLDVRMPGMKGPDLQEQLARTGNDLPVVYLTGHGDVPTSVRAIKGGAVDFLLKPVEDEVLLAAISQALAGHAAHRVSESERRQSEARLGRLSVREREVMEHVIGGQLNKQIAYDLGISEKTVKAHRGRVMEKLQMRSVAELVRLCEAVGIRPRSTGAKTGRSSPALPEPEARARPVRSGAA